MPELDAERIAALCKAFFEPRVMLTAAELDLFTILSGHWLSAEAVATPRKWDPRALRILLDALVVMGMLNKRNNTYSATTRTVEYLSSEGAFCMLDQTLHAADLWNDWSKLTGRVTGAGSVPQRNPIRASVETANLMTPRIAPGIAALVRPESARRFVDVGGGAGAYTMAFLMRDRSLQATIFDYPEVLPVCAEHLREAELDAHVTLVAGDYLHDPLPAQMGMVFLSAVVQRLSLKQSRDLFHRCWQALLPGGRVVILDYVMSPDRLQPRTGTLHAVNLLVSTEGGEPHTFGELREALEAAGFVDARLLQDGDRMNAVVEAYRPRE